MSGQRDDPDCGPVLTRYDVQLKLVLPRLELVRIENRTSSAA